LRKRKDKPDPRKSGKGATSSRAARAKEREPGFSPSGTQLLTLSSLSESMMAHEVDRHAQSKDPYPEHIIAGLQPVSAIGSCGRTLLCVAFDVDVDDLAFDSDLRRSTRAASTTVKERRLSAA